MKKQYLVQVKYKKYNPDKWVNIMGYDVNGGKRYAATLYEAKQAIERTRKMWDDDRNGKRKPQSAGMFAINIEPTKDDTFEIVDTRIRVREVTEWSDAE